MAAMKKVLSPSSETMITEREARNPWRKLSSDIRDPCSANSSAGESDLSCKVGSMTILLLYKQSYYLQQTSAFPPSPLNGSAGSLSARTMEKNENMEKTKTTAKLTLFILLTL